MIASEDYRKALVLQSLLSGGLQTQGRLVNICPVLDSRCITQLDIRVCVTIRVCHLNHLTCDPAVLMHVSHPWLIEKPGWGMLWAGLALATGKRETDEVGFARSGEDIETGEEVGRGKTLESCPCDLHRNFKIYYHFIKEIMKICRCTGPFFISLIRSFTFKFRI